MFCPKCKDEFRAGFTHCASCDVDLVESLSETPQAPQPVQGAATRPAVARMVDYCGFFALDDARDARRQLKASGILTEIAIRDVPGLDNDDEEYWLRVEASHIAQVTKILGFDPASDAAGDESFRCDSCGEAVSAQESFCSHCGAKFDED
jgi:hypothetical protein